MKTYRVDDHFHRGQTYYDVFEIDGGKETNIRGPFESRRTAQKIVKELRDAEYTRLGITPPLTPMEELKARNAELEARIKELEVKGK